MVYKEYPVIRNMLSYAVIWPTSYICEQTIFGKKWKSYDWVQAARFSFYGAFFTTPLFYAWFKICRYLWPRRNLMTAIKKALVKQVTYTPTAISSFFFGMTLLEGKTVDEAIEEVRNKFLFTYKVAVCAWSILKSIKLALIAEENRTKFVNLSSLVWNGFLVYMKHFELEEEAQLQQQSSPN